MLKIFQNRRIIYDRFCQYIINANITNEKGLKVSSVYEEFYENYDKDSCPIVILQKGPYSSLKFELEQFSFIYPTSFDLQLITIDYSLKNFDEADLLAEDLMSKSIKAIEDGLNNDIDTKRLLKKVEIQSISYGPSEVRSDIYFSDLRTVLVCPLADFD